MPVFQFRLQPWLDQKLELESKAKAAISEKQHALQTEQATYGRLLESETRIERALTQARAELLVTAKANLGADVGHRNEYVKALERDLQTAHDETLLQKFALEEAEVRLEQAYAYAAECSREVEKLDKYREKQEKRFLAAAAKKEELEQDDLGTVMFLNRRTSA